MNDKSVPEILKDESRFAACAREAANHIVKQPQDIRQPIAIYGAHIAANASVKREVLVNFFRAFCQAKMQTWTSQLNDPLYRVDLERLENTIALNVYLVSVIQDAD